MDVSGSWCIMKWQSKVFLAGQHVCDSLAPEVRVWWAKQSSRAFPGSNRHTNKKNTKNVSQIEEKYTG